MERKQLTIVKVGGKIVEEPETLERLLTDFEAIPGKKILVHGGGRSATALASRLGIESHMVDGRRITDAEMLDVVTMVYGGLVNKNIVAKLQARGLNAIGLSGTDCNTMLSVKRPAGAVDYGFVGDVKQVNAGFLSSLLDEEIVPVLAPLTHDGKGQLLNTNADTIAGETAKALAPYFKVTLIYCFEKPGVLLDENDDTSVIPYLSYYDFPRLVQDGTISGGMIPKIQNAFAALQAGVSNVLITKAQNLDTLQGTTIAL
ncbi:MAG: acetylglutamate kinase [Bacteroidaceae bacterium]|nr:acetylglutamate kinase [Bacteroidaceae bacterium]